MVVGQKPTLLYVARDAWPTTRVDLTELFSRHLSLCLSVTWLMPREEPGPAVQLSRTDGEVYALPSKRAGGVVAAMANACSFFRLNLLYAYRASRGRWDAVQVRDSVLSALPFLVATKLARRPFFYWMSYPVTEGFSHRARSGGARANPLKRLAQHLYGLVGTVLLYRVILPGADHVFVQSEKMKEDVSAEGVVASKLTPVPMGVSSEIFNVESVAAARDGGLRGRRILLYMGSVEPVRRIDLLVEAAAMVAQSAPDVLLVFVGACAAREEAELRRVASAHEFESNLIFLGQLPLDQALGYVRSADVCLAPMAPIKILLSTSPTKLVEYLAMGRPVVASDHPDQTQVLSQSGAGLCAPFTAEGFSSAILQLLHDPVAAEEMGKRGPPWVKANRDYQMLANLVAAEYRRWLPLPAPVQGVN